MYLVVFEAAVKDLDEMYELTVQKIKDLAMNDHGCLYYVSTVDKGREITLSYWKTEEQIHKWKQNIEYKDAIMMGQSYWYHSYRMQVTRVLDQCKFSAERDLQTEVSA